MSNSSQAMMRAWQTYMDEVCRIIVEDCGHAMCWIGMAEEDAQKSVRLAACAGSMLSDLLFAPWRDEALRRGYASLSCH